MNHSLSSMFSTFTHVVSRKDAVILYHTLTQEKLIIARDQLEGGDVCSSLIDRLSSLKFIATPEEDAYLLNRALQKAPSQVNIKSAYIMVTNKCNFRCRYCTIHYNTGGYGTHAEPASVRKMVSAWYRATKDAGRRTLTIYGGEPLSNINGVKSLLDTLKEVDIQGDVSTGIITNGSLLDNAIVDMLQAHNVFPIISLDGKPVRHDSMRVDWAGQPTFNRVVKGIDTWRKTGRPFGISLVIGTHNVDTLLEDVAFIIDRFSPTTLGLSLQHVKPENFRPDDSTAVDAVIEAFEYAAGKGLYIEHCMRRIRPMVLKKIRYRDCPACGAMLRMAPDGSLGPCENLLLTKNHFSGNILYQPWDEIVNHPVTIDWGRRSQFFFHEDCQACPAFSVCGGGCAYDSWLENGDIHTPDTKTCILSKRMINKALELLLVAYAPKLQPGNGIYGPLTINECIKILCPEGNAHINSCSGLGEVEAVEIKNV